MTALLKRDHVMGNAVDVYRAMQPNGGEFTHGRPKKRNQRRIDICNVASTRGPARRSRRRGGDALGEPRETAGFSYVKMQTRKECYKQSDHNIVQLTLRLPYADPPPEAGARYPTGHPLTPRDHESGRGADWLIEGTTAPQRGTRADSSQQHGRRCNDGPPRIDTGGLRQASEIEGKGAREAAHEHSHAHPTPSTAPRAARRLQGAAAVGTQPRTVPHEAPKA